MTKDMEEYYQEEQKKYVRFLLEEFFSQYAEHGLCRDLRLFLVTLANSFGKKQDYIADKYGEKLRKIDIDTDVSPSTISRIINDKINPKLKEFSESYSVVHHPIQIFSEYIDPETKKKKYGCVVACKKNTADDNVLCLEDTIPFDKAIRFKDIIQLINKDRSHKSNRAQSLFRFEYQWNKFVGRDKEMERLRRFAHHEGEPLLWWMVTGAGGTGKSRLGLEICKELKADNWNAGFLGNIRELTKLENEQPSRPTFIVIDYTCNQSKELGQIVSSLFEQCNDWQKPVRILLLQRHEKSCILEDFIKSDRTVIEDELRYNKITSTKEESSLKLDTIGEEWVELLIVETFKASKGNREPSLDEIESIKKFLENESLTNNPLYIIFASDACARQGNLRSWNKDELHDNILNHMYKIWEENEIDRKHINLLILATMTNGIDIESEDYSSCLDMTIGKLKTSAILPTENDISEKKYQVLCDSTSTKEFAPLTPDILGEYFVLQQWSERRVDEHRMILLTRIACYYKPSEFLAFLIRSIEDFPDVLTLNMAIEIMSNLSMTHRDKAQLLRLMSSIYCRFSRYSNVASLYSNLVQLHEERHDDEDILRELIEATTETIKISIEKLQVDKALTYYNLLVQLWEQHNEIKGFSLEYVSSMLILQPVSSGVEYLKDVLEHYTHTNNFWKEFQANNGLSLRLFQVISGVPQAYISNNQIEKALEYCSQIILLWKANTENKAFLLALSKSITNIIHCDILLEDPIESSEHHARVRKKFISFARNDREFAIMLATETCIYLRNADSIEVTKSLHKRLNNICKLYLNDVDFISLLSRASEIVKN